jgi:AraC-like DNA-binding protein
LQSVSPIPAAPESQTHAIASLTLHEGGETPAAKSVVLPGTMQRLLVARERIYESARSGQRIRTYEVALDLDMSEFHFARQFRLAFDRSPHVYYDEVRADTARAMLAQGLSEGTVARRIGFRRPAELRALLVKRPEGTLPPELSR